MNDVLIGQSGHFNVPRAVSILLFRNKGHATLLNLRFVCCNTDRYVYATISILVRIELPFVSNASPKTSPSLCDIPLSVECVISFPAQWIAFFHVHLYCVNLPDVWSTKNKQTTTNRYGLWNGYISLLSIRDMHSLYLHLSIIIWNRSLWSIGIIVMLRFGVIMRRTWWLVWCSHFRGKVTQYRSSQTKYATCIKIFENKNSYNLIVQNEVLMFDLLHRLIRNSNQNSCEQFLAQIDSKHENN